MNRQSNIFAVPAQITREIDLLCRDAKAPLNQEQYKAIHHLVTTLFTRGVITPKTADRISETVYLIHDP